MPCLVGETHWEIVDSSRLVDDSGEILFSESAPVMYGVAESFKAFAADTEFSAFTEPQFHAIMIDDSPTHCFLETSPHRL